MMSEMAGNVRVPIMYWPCSVGSMLKCLQLWLGGRERLCKTTMFIIMLEVGYTTLAVAFRNDS